MSKYYFNIFIKTQRYTVELDTKYVEDDGKIFWISVYIDGCEDEVYCDIELPTGEVENKIGFSDEEIEYLKQKLLPLYQGLIDLIRYYEIEEKDYEYDSLYVRVKLVDSKLRLLERYRSTDRTELEVGKYYYIYCGSHELYYDKLSLYKYTGYEFVTDEGLVLNYSHIIDVETSEYLNVDIIKVTDKADFYKVHEFIGLMYGKIDLYPEYKIRTDDNGNVTISIRGSKITIQKEEIDKANHLGEFAKDKVKQLISNSIYPVKNDSNESEYHIIKIDEFDLRGILTNSHAEYDLQIEMIYYTDKKYLYKIKIICNPIYKDLSYIYLQGEISSIEEPEEVIFSVPFIDTNNMREISYPVNNFQQKNRVLTFIPYPFTEEDDKMEKFQSYLKKNRGKVQDFLINFAGLSRKIKFEIEKSKFKKFRDNLS